MKLGYAQAKAVQNSDDILYLFKKNNNVSNSLAYTWTALFETMFTILFVYFTKAQSIVDDNFSTKIWEFQNF